MRVISFNLTASELSSSTEQSSLQCLAGHTGMGWPTFHTFAFASICFWLLNKHKTRSRFPEGIQRGQRVGADAAAELLAALTPLLTSQDA